MKAMNKMSPADKDIDEMTHSLGTISAHLSAIEKLFARRFDEISAEINAASQQMDMAEESTMQRFAEIFQMLHAVSFTGDGSTPANTGVELNAVVDMTENAANTILDAAERISNKLRENEIDWSNEASREHALASISGEVESILLACSFQDITAQRIKKTLENISSIEDRLGSVISKFGVDVQKLETKPNLGKTSSQDEIDQLFSYTKDSGKSE